MQQQRCSDMHKTYLSLTRRNVLAISCYVFNARRKHHRVKLDIFRLNTNNSSHIIKHSYNYYHHHHYQIYDLLLNGSLKTLSSQVPHTVRASGNKKLRVSLLRPGWGMLVHKRVFSTITFMGLVQCNNPPLLFLSSKYPNYWTSKKTNLTCLFLLLNSQLLTTSIRNRVFRFLNNSITDGFTQTNNKIMPNKKKNHLTQKSQVIFILAG